MFEQQKRAFNVEASRIQLGHLLDERNTGFADRERYAEWFAMRHGYLATGGRAARARRERVVRRHDAK